MAGPGAKPVPGPQRLTLRLDKWLWQARFFRARPMAAQAILDGSIRVNGQRTHKPGYALSPGDVLTFALSGRVHVVKVVALGTRRGPVHEATTLYLDLDAPTGGAATPSPLE